MLIICKYLFQTILALHVVVRSRDSDEQAEVASLEGVQEEQGDCAAAVVVCSEVLSTS